MSNTCMRCGKDRIVIKRWEEVVHSERRDSVIVHILTACPDPDCQKLVDKNLEQQKIKEAERKQEKEDKDKAIKEARMKNVLSRRTK